VVLRILRNPDGDPGLHVRALAGVVVLGLVAISAPLFVVPVLRFLLDVL
jgi:hypothetical protein